MISGNTISLSQANSVTLPDVGQVSWFNVIDKPIGFLDNVDNINDADSDLSNEIITDISLTNNMLTIQEGLSSEQVDLSSLSKWEDLSNSEIHYSDGQVGIGVNSGIKDRLHIRSDAGENALRVQIGNATKFRIFSNGRIALGSNPSNIGENNVFIFDSLGIGEAEPQEKLHVNVEPYLKKMLHKEIRILV